MITNQTELLKNKLEIKLKDKIILQIKVQTV